VAWAKGELRPLFRKTALLRLKAARKGSAEFCAVGLGFKGRGDTAGEQAGRHLAELSDPLWGRGRPPLARAQETQEHQGAL
jgi:hypothetical protein